MYGERVVVDKYKEIWRYFRAKRPIYKAITFLSTSSLSWVLSLSLCLSLAFSLTLSLSLT